MAVLTRVEADAEYDAWTSQWLNDHAGISNRDKMYDDRVAYLWAKHQIEHPGQPMIFID